MFGADQAVGDDKSIFETLKCELGESSISGILPEDDHVDTEDDDREVSAYKETSAKCVEFRLCLPVVMARSNITKEH